jgi:hypothetical protein
MLVGVECKAHVTPATHQRERCHNEFLFRFHATTSSGTISNSTTSTTELYTVVSVYSSDFYFYIGSMHEAVQLLHQAYKVASRMCYF